MAVRLTCTDHRIIEILGLRLQTGCLSHIKDQRKTHWCCDTIAGYYYYYDADIKNKFDEKDPIEMEKK